MSFQRQIPSPVLLNQLLPEFEYPIPPRKMLPTAQHPVRTHKSKRVFHFVDSHKYNRKDREEQRQIHVHAMRHFIQQRRCRNHEVSSRRRSFEWVKKDQSQLKLKVWSSSPPKSTAASPGSRLNRNNTNARSLPENGKGPRQVPKRKARSRSSSPRLQTPDQKFFAQFFGRSASPVAFSGCGRDPFHTLPGGRCTRDEEAIFQCYFDVLPESLYGIRKDAPYNPQRDMVFPQSFMHPSVYQWVLVSASSYFRARGGQIPASYTIRRRSIAYRLINEGLDDPSQYLSDGLVLAITAAVMVESRYGDPHATRLHVEGLKSFLNKRGGISSLVGKPWHACVIQGLHLAGSGLGMIKSVQDIDELRQQTEVLIETLWNIQDSDLQRRRQQFAHEQDVVGFKERDDDEALNKYKSKSLLEEYILCRRATLSPGSPLFTVLGASRRSYHINLAKNPSASYTVSQHCFLAVLLSLNIALWEYHTDLRAGIYFLTSLTQALKRNSIFDKRGTIANIETLNWFLVTGGHDIRGKDGKWVQEEFLRKWAVIDAMRVIARLGRETREKVQEALYGFLVDQECTGNDYDSEFHNVKQEEENDIGKEREEEIGWDDFVLFDEEVLGSIRTEAFAGLEEA